MKKQILFILPSILILTFSFPKASSCQTHSNNISSIKFDARINRVPAFNIDWDDQTINLPLIPPLATISSSPSPGFEGQLTYYRSLSPKFKLGIGIIGGAQSYQLSITATPDFINTLTRIYTIDITEYDLSYLGLTLEGNYSIPLGKKSSLNITGGLSALYFIPWSLGLETADENKTIFNVELQVNPSNKILFMSKLGVSYSYNLNEKFSLNAGLLTSYSNKTLVETIGKFQLRGDNETITGELSKRSMQWGLELGVTYNL